MGNIVSATDKKTSVLSDNKDYLCTEIHSRSKMPGECNLNWTNGRLHRTGRRTEQKGICGGCLHDGFTFFLWNGGVEGTDCTPELYIDNIRVVPINK